MDPAFFLRTGLQAMHGDEPFELSVRMVKQYLGCSHRQAWKALDALDLVEHRAPHSTKPGMYTLGGTHSGTHPGTQGGTHEASRISSNGAGIHGVNGAGRNASRNAPRNARRNESVPPQGSLPLDPPPEPPPVIPHTPTPPPGQRLLTYGQAFEEAWEHYPRKVAKKKAYAAWRARLREGYTEKQMHDGVLRYAAQVARTGEPVRHGSTFFGPEDPPWFTLPYDEGARSTNGQRRPNRPRAAEFDEDALLRGGG